MLRIILARHAQAEDAGAGSDADRKLVDEGRDQAKLLGRLLAATMGKVDEAWSSPYPRARETADLVAKELKIQVRDEADLAPGGDLEQLAWKLSRRGPGAVLLAGHQPDLGLLAARLLGVRSPVILKKSGICVIDTPDAARPLGRAVATLNPKMYPEILERREYAPWMIKKQLL